MSVSARPASSSTSCGPRCRPGRSAAGTTCSRRWARRSASCSIPVGSRALRFDGRGGHPTSGCSSGVNGVGKTTTIGKLARRQSAAGHSVLLAAGDTFRAAAADQLAMWAERTGTEIVRGAEGADPSAIVFDAVQRAAAREQRPRAGGHGRSPAHKGQPGGGAEEDPAGRRPRPGQRDGGPPRPGRHHGPERR